MGTILGMDRRKLGFEKEMIRSKIDINSMKR